VPTLQDLFYRVFGDKTMSETILAKDVTLHDLEGKFHLQLVEDPQFFPEWQTDLPTIDEHERQFLDKLRAGYFNLIKYPSLLENTVQMAVLGPLLYLADFFLAPFHIRSEVSVSISDVDEEITVEGKIDILALKEHLWVVVIESKRAAFSIEAGLAQLLSYMLANPAPNHLNFGLITTGGSSVFVKLVDGQTPQYALSRIFELRNPGNDLYAVLSVLKRFRELFLEEDMGDGYH
jgi:hypothetical protein